MKVLQSSLIHSITPREYRDEVIATARKEKSDKKIGSNEDLDAVIRQQYPHARVCL